METLNIFFVNRYLLLITLTSANAWLLTALVATMIFIASRFFKSSLNSSRNTNEALLIQIQVLQTRLDYISTKEEKTRTDAEKSADVKEKMLSSLSHEIRTPMNGILGMTTLLDETNLTAEQREYIDTIIKSGKILLNKVNEVMLNDKIEHAKISASHEELQQRGTDLRNCIEEVMDMFAMNATQKGIDLLYEIKSDVPVAVISDSNRVQQVLINLVEKVLANAKFNEVFIGVHFLKDHDGDVPMLAFEVTDIRIANASTLAPLLEGSPFAPAPGILNENEIDFGLAISKKLVDDLGGKLCELTPSNFIFSIAINALAGHKIDRAAYSLNGFDGKQVLIVNNNFTASSILENQLHQWNLLPVICTSAKTAMEFLSTNICNLIITDMEMPDINGIELSKLLRSQYPAIPVILLNPFNDERYKYHEEIFGEISVINKPLKFQMLFDSILNALRHAKKGGGHSQVSIKNLSDKFAKQYPLKILIAEDNAINQKWAIKILNKMGYQPAIAENGHMVLDMVGQETYDLILMDVQMPEMDGLEATRMIRLCLDKQPIVIAMTANVMHGDRLACMQAGMDDYISKPVDLNELVNMLEKWSLLIRERKMQTRSVA